MVLLLSDSLELPLHDDLGKVNSQLAMFQCSLLGTRDITSEPHTFAYLHFISLSSQYFIQNVHTYVSLLLCTVCTAIHPCLPKGTAFTGLCTTLFPLGQCVYEIITHLHYKGVYIHYAMCRCCIRSAIKHVPITRVCTYVHTVRIAIGRSLTLSCCICSVLKHVPNTGGVHIQYTTYVCIAIGLSPLRCCICSVITNFFQPKE